MRTVCRLVVSLAVLVCVAAAGAQTSAPASQENEPRAKALAAAKAAAEKALSAQAKAAVVLTAAPQIVEADNAWTFTWQGHVDAGDYIATVRANEKGETKLLQVKIGGSAARD